MVGDSVHDDMLGALAVGMPGVLVDRTDEYGEFDGPRIRSLAELPGILKELAARG
jgi:FMN phosphatase YigB (HAD superfamily)